MGRKVTLRAKKAAKKKGKGRPSPRRRFRRYLYAPPSPAMARFRVFEHDFHTVLEASVKAGGRAPAAIVRDAELAAVAMGEVIAARKPKSDEDRPRPRTYGRRRSPWREWQSLFDRMIHSMSERTSLSASQVVRRSEQITDLALEVLRSRRKTTKRAA